MGRRILTTKRPELAGGSIATKMLALGKRRADVPPLSRGFESANLYVGLLGHLESVIDFDAETASGALQLCMSKQRLYRP